MADDQLNSDSSLDKQLSEAMERELSGTDDDMFSSDVDSLDAQLAAALAELDFDEFETADVKPTLAEQPDANPPAEPSGDFIDEQLEAALAGLDFDETEAIDINLPDVDLPSDVDEDSIDAQLNAALAGLDFDEGDGIFDFEGDKISEPATIEEDTLLNYKLEEALAKDQEADDSLMSESIDDFVKDVSVHVDEDEEFAVEEKRGRFAWLTDRIENISPKFLISFAVVLAVLVVGSVAFAVNTGLASMRNRDELKQRGTIIRIGSTISNSAGFIFTNTPIDFIDETITLTKMNLSRISAVLYFDREIDLDIYDATLTDDWGRVYYLDYSYYEDENSVFKGEMRLWFDPLPQGFKHFDLTITERDTQTSTRTRFTAGQDMALEFPRYLSAAATVDCNAGDIAEVEISSAVFSNTGSQIMYTIRKAIPGEEVVLSKPGSDYQIRLTENGRLVVRDAQSFEPRSFDAHGLTLGRVDFVPLQNINSTVKIHFDYMYRKVSVNSEISLDDVFYTKPNPEHRIKVGPYELVIERGGVQGSQFVLVMHAIDTRLDAISEMSNRVQAFPEVALVARKPDGTSVRIEPRIIRDSWQGTDVVFDGSQERAFLFGMPTEQIFFEISSVYFKLPPAEVEIDLDQAERRMAIIPTTAIENINAAFSRRLAYRTGEYALRELDRFSENVLNNHALMSQYSQIDTKDTSSVIHVPMWYYDGDKFYAIVRETWRAYPNEFFHRMHKTVSDHGQRGWIVVEDEIIK